MEGGQLSPTGIFKVSLDKYVHDIFFSIKIRVKEALRKEEQALLGTNRGFCALCGVVGVDHFRGADRNISRVNVLLSDPMNPKNPVRVFLLH